MAKLVLYYYGIFHHLNLVQWIILDIFMRSNVFQNDSLTFFLERMEQYLNNIGLSKPFKEQIY